MRVPRALRLKRSELGLTSKEYVILLDYVDYYLYCRSVNPYRHLSEVNGVSERSIRSTLSRLEKKGFLKREVHVAGNGRTKGVVFSLAPLVEKLKAAVRKTSPTEGEENLPYVTEGFFPPNTREDLNTRQESKKKTSTGGAAVNDGRVAGGEEEKKWKDPYCAVRWYNEIFGEIYEEAAGQPVLTGGREYKSAQTYFHRLRELNPQASPEEIYGRATEGALFMLASQLEGGVFGWMHKPPDICMLAGQAQSVDYHLRKIYAEQTEGDFRDGEEKSAGESVRLSFREKIREGENASKQIKRVYEELRGIERASRGGTEIGGRAAGALDGAPGHKAKEQKASQGSPRVSRKRRTG